MTLHREDRAAARGGAVLTSVIQPRWGDVDVYGHVNHVHQIRYLEEARMRTWGVAPASPDSDALSETVFARLLRGGDTVVADVHVEYHREIRYTPTMELRVQTWLSRVGSSSATACFRMLSAADDVVHTLARVVIVFVDERDRRPRRLTPQEQERLGAHLGPELELRLDSR